MSRTHAGTQLASGPWHQRHPSRRAPLQRSTRSYQRHVGRRRSSQDDLPQKSPDRNSRLPDTRALRTQDHQACSKFRLAHRGSKRSAVAKAKERSISIGAGAGSPAPLLKSLDPHSPPPRTTGQQRPRDRRGRTIPLSGDLAERLPPFFGRWTGIVPASLERLPTHPSSRRPPHVVLVVTVETWIPSFRRRQRVLRPPRRRRTTTIASCNVSRAI